jgi:DNA helicase-4
MDLVWLVLGLSVAAAVVALATLVVLPDRRKRTAKHVADGLNDARSTLTRIENATKSYLIPTEYISERIARPLKSELKTFVEQTLPSIEKSVRRTRDDAILKEFDSISFAASQLRQAFVGQNHKYTQRAIAKHSKLLKDELRLDTAQQEATVRDDERNLVVAAAGSGKTRTLIARVRYLLERQVPPDQILAITFTKKAAKEMEDRLKQMAVPVAFQEIDGVTVSTLHALGKRIVQAEMVGPISVADDNWTESLVAAALRDAREGRDQQLASPYRNAILNFHRKEDETAPPLGTDLTYRTLRGEHVRSIGERVIADFLFTHHVPYQYETKASWANVGVDRNAYNPDFTLPAIDASIEYWGINRAGNVPQGWRTTSEQYNQGMRWKREEFRRVGKKLIEIYDYERVEGILETALEARLVAAGATLRPMSHSELEQMVKNFKYIGTMIEHQLVDFISNARSLRLAPGDILKRLNSATPRVYYFGVLAVAILTIYDRELTSQGRIDFSDMLHRAADIMEKGPNPLARFDHVLVDEFQDTSSSMARLVNTLVKANNAHLFAVGDDWQAIYGFAGGDVDHVVNFESHFGPASLTMLNTNYRSPAIIVEAGAALIAHNPSQIPKQVAVSNRGRGEAYIHEVPDNDLALIDKAIGLIQEERKRTSSDDILVLSRTNHILNEVRKNFVPNRIPLADLDRNITGVRVMSAHKAKGLEADVVVVVNASDDLLGFPSKIENPDVLEPVRMHPGNDRTEERRLFYVAVTRAKERLHLIVRQGLPSPYIAEIEGTTPHSQKLSQHVLRPGNRFNDTFCVEQVYPLTESQTRARIRQCGVLTTNTGEFSFTSWMPYHFEQGGTYQITGVFLESPYQNRQRIKLDRDTWVQQRIRPQPPSRADSTRQLLPRPPPLFRPLQALENS